MPNGMSTSAAARPVVFSLFSRVGQSKQQVK